jgi:hypothetical protein
MGKRHHIKSSRETNDLSAGLRFHFRLPSFRAGLRDKRGGVFAIALPWFQLFLLSQNSQAKNFCHRFAIASKRKALSPILASLSTAGVGSFSNCK